MGFVHIFLGLFRWPPGTIPHTQPHPGRRAQARYAIFATGTHHDIGVTMTTCGHAHCRGRCQHHPGPHRQKAKRPKGLSTPLVCAMGTRPKHQPTVQHRRNGVKVCCPPPCSWGMRPHLLTPCIQGKPQHCAEAHDADHVEQQGCNPPMATTTGRHNNNSDRGPPVTPPPLPCPQGQKSQALHTSARRQSPYPQWEHATTH